MVTLEAFGNIPERQSPLGYVWHRISGERILIVIDDWYDVPKWESSSDEENSSAHAYGLKLLRDQLSAIDSTRAIGFFSLPDPQSKTFSNDIQRLIDGISQWVLSVKDDNSRGYVLVDYYYGEGFSSANLAGTHVVEAWKNQESLLLQTLAISIKLAHISIGGARQGANQYNLEVFKKSDMNSTQRLPTNLRQWLEIDEHPIRRLWHESRHWFLAGRDDDDIMQHTQGNIQGYLESPEDGRFSMYRSNIERALGLKLPDSWWQCSESVGLMHESLKCLCGAMFCGQCNEDSLKRPTSTGAAFLIALLAHYRQCGHIEPFVSSQRTWSNCDRVASSFVFPKQDCATAKESTLALYDFFRLLFEVRSSSDDGQDRRTTQVNKVLFYERGRLLKIELAWSAQRRAADGFESLSERATQLLNATPVNIPAAPPQNTREAALRLWRLMAINEEGCFAPGVVHLNKNILTIGSVM